MVNLKEKAQNAVTVVKKKALPVVASAATAISAMSITAFAEGESSSSMYSTIADSFKTGIASAADGIALIFSAILPIGIGIVGMYAAIGAGKKILTKLTG